MKQVPVQIIGPFRRISKQRLQEVKEIILNIVEPESNRGFLMTVSNEQSFYVLTAMINKPMNPPIAIDLLKNLLDTLGVKLEKVVITEFIEPNYHALVYLDYLGQKLTLGARPTDAITLAFRYNGLIFANEDLLMEGEIIPVTSSINLSSNLTAEEDLDWLRNLDPKKLPQA